MAPSKLYFFDARGRSEVMKLLLEAAKAPYENLTFSWDSWYAEFQKDTPFGKCPVLEVDGKKIGQTMAISLYLAEKYGLNGSSLEERIVINQALTFREELMVEEIVPYVEKDLDAKATKNKVFYEEKMPRYLGFFTKMIKENSKGKDFVLGEKLSAADCAIFAATTTLEQTRPDVLAQFPEVAALRKRVAQYDGIKQYVESRKFSPI